MGKILVALGICVLAFGCASGPELAKYPEPEIDRPYTLPVGVATWHIPALVGEVVGPSGGRSTLYPVPVPLEWESSLSDEWNLIYLPIPLGVSHQFYFDRSSRIGATLFGGFSYNSTEGFRAAPTLTASYRQALSKDVALEVGPSFTPDIPFKSGQNFYWSASFAAGPVFQTDKRFAVKPAVSLDAYHGRYAKGGMTETTYSTVDGSTVIDTTVAMGLGASAVWSFDRQWDFRPSYNYTGIGARDGAHAHIGVVEFVHFW
jgi:hypothetical protein